MKVSVDHGGAAALGKFVAVHFFLFVFEISGGDVGGFVVELLGCLWFDVSPLRSRC